MRKRGFIVTVIIGVLLTSVASRSASIAQEDDYQLANEDVFGKLRRPLVRFSHVIHSENMEDAGCGVCHHSLDSETDKIIYIEGEELSCSECHGAQKENNKPALREAYHGSCTACHRNMIKIDKRKTGPTTCGGCHKKV